MRGFLISKGEFYVPTSKKQRQSKYKEAYNKERRRIANFMRDAKARERGRALMEPDEDDLKMPLGQKIVILAIVGLAAVWLAATMLG